ncbi:hypothetical protein SLEP1_g33575 [Rubroshorea leprosula]|uniref:Flavin-containing monooxygenase n=1 Tax=Rubroshorea leprosula TaxID=152421 RepID=A0AAV5KH94_9ROSI|nr:hypothetical protein SLEP1_g33575 [Rubroshorea leprosula]
MDRKIAIIGAGVSGLIACKYTLSKGFHPIVFEAESSIGGVWSKTLKSTKLQTSKGSYRFADFPWPSSVTEDFPDHRQVYEYLQAYARHFDLLKHINFNNKVVGIEYEGASEAEMQSWSFWSGNGEPFSSTRKWKVHVQDINTLSTEIYEVDFVILCLGRFSGLPNIPEFPPNKGPEAFHGKVIHSMEYAAMDDESAAKFIEGKKVTVVGFQKSALDIANECAAANGVENPCTVLYRTECWTILDSFAWGVHMKNLYGNRFSELLVHKPGEGLLLSILATMLSPVRWCFSKFVESDLRRRLPLAKFGMVPKQSFFENKNSCLIPTLPEKFYGKVEEGSIRLKKAPSFSFCKDGVVIDGNEAAPIQTDLVILATGFRGDKKLKDIFVSQTFQDCISGTPKAAVPLYRDCIHPRIPQLAVMGFADSGSKVFTSEMKCLWLVELLDRKFKLPRIKEMEKDAEKWVAYWKQYSGRYYRKSCLLSTNIWYNDQLCKDMGWNPKRKKGFFAELFEPYGPMDYVAP